MAVFRRLQKFLVLPVLSAFLLGTVPIAAVNAKMIGTDQVLGESSVNADRDRVIEFVERDDVQQQMQTLGVDPGEAMQRVQSLSDSEIRQVAGKLDRMPAGEGALGSVLGAAVLIFLVLLLTDVLCLTDVFDFTTACAT